MKVTTLKPFIKYFPESIEYPGDQLVFDPLPMGVQYLYVSNSLLDGFINYVDKIKAFVIGRYLRWDEAPGVEIEVQEPPSSSKWAKKTPRTKSELFDVLTTENAVYHSKLDTAFQDDVLILGKAYKNGDKEQPEFCWVFFWYDRDSSDCCIGRFQSDDEESEVVASFVDFVRKLDVNEYGEREIPLHYFRGWLSS